ncbi:MAG: glycosyltransferase family 4 protein [Candidatus Coatesbacteria bacterium]|nr:glycosyltransferase family 4 protein [Candidatus Coatesbacteria bacterium]
MKILVASSLHPIDDPRVFQKEAVSLAKRHDVHIVAVGAPTCGAEENSKGVSLHPFERRGGKILGTIRAYREILKRVREVRPEVFHFHDPDLVPLGLWLNSVGKCKVIYDIHEDVKKTLMKKRWLPGPLKKPLGWLFGKLEMMAVRRFSAAVVAEPYAMKRFKVPNAVLIRNYFPLFPDTPRSVFDGSRPLRLIYVGSLTETRGVLSLAKALDHIRTPVELVLAGKFHSDDFRSKVLANRSNIRYLGWVPLDKVFDFLHEADIGMNCILPAPSHDEMLGTKVFDYMAARLPIITSNFSVWPEMVEKAGCGLCVDPADPRAIAAAVEELASNPERIASMGEVGRKLFEEKYNWSMEETKLLDLYDSLSENSEAEAGRDE